MPKMKSNRSAGKRFRVTKKGKVLYTQAGLRHNLGNMSGKNRRRLARPTELPREQVPQVLRLLGKR
jgi:large subunit ribosomal protein L35